MVIKVFESSYDSFKDKLKNPFYGTLFVVWVIRNREFLYNVFFHDKLTSDKRLEVIRSHFLNWDSLLNFLGTILISLALMILIYVSLNLSRFIVEFSERKLKPLIQQIFNKSSIVSREEYLILENERDYFQKKYSEERSERIKLQKELDNKTENIQINDNETYDKEEKGKTVEEGEKGIPENIITTWLKLRPSYYDDFKKIISLMEEKVPVYEIKRKMKDLASTKEFINKKIIETLAHENIHYYNFTEFGDKFVNHFKIRDSAKNS